MPIEVQHIRALADAARLSLVSRNVRHSAATPRCIVVVRNEIHRLPEFLRHHRELGVTAFAAVDNGSTDGSFEFLQRQADVDLWRADELFSTDVKHGWINFLVDNYGRDRWYLLADADEHVVYDGAPDIGIATFIDDMTRLGQSQVRGMLVDMYAPGRALAAHRAAHVAMRDAFPLFDAVGYDEQRLEKLTARRGGPRARVFDAIEPGFKPQLTKYPLFRPGSDGLFLSPHYNWPRASAVEDVCKLGILHYKFDVDALLRVGKIAEEKRYWNESFEYQVYRDALRMDPALTLATPFSVRYDGPRSLVRAGLIAPRDVPPACEGLEAIVDLARRQHRARLLARPAELV